MQVLLLKINIPGIRDNLRANEMVIAYKTRLLVPPRTGRPRCRKVRHKPLEEQHYGEVIDFPRTPVCEQYEKQRKWAVCGQKNVPVKEIYIREMEKILLSLAKDDPNLGVAIVRADKKSLNALNKIGGKHGAGDSCLSLYMNTLEQTIRSTFPFAK
jgi:hypothetical protein